MNLYIVTSSCTLISRYNHILSFLRIYFQTSLLTINYQSLCVFIYIMYASAQYINMISLNYKLMCHLISSHPDLSETS